MSFAGLPLWALGAIAAATVAAVVALYLLRRTPPRRAVSSVHFWQEALQRARPKVLRARRVPIASLFVSLLVALLLVVEMGDPRLGASVLGTTVVVVEAGQSMGAAEGGRARVARALDEARSWAERATARGEVAIVRAGIRPEVIVPATRRAGDVAAALAARGDEVARADDGPADVTAALALADALVRTRGGAGAGQIVVIGDAAPSAPTAAPALFVPIGAPCDTIAIISLVARRDPLAVGEYAVRASVRSLSSRRAVGKLVVRDRDVVLFEQSFELGPLETRELSGQGFSSAQGELVARLEDVEIAGSSDALASDDVAYAVVPALSRTKVLLVSPGSPWIRGGARGAWGARRRRDRLARGARRSLRRRGARRRLAAARARAAGDDRDWRGGRRAGAARAARHGVAREPPGARRRTARGDAARPRVRARRPAR